MDDSSRNIGRDRVPARKAFRGSNSLSPRPKMRPRDGGLVAHGVWAMRIDEAAQWLLRDSGDRRYPEFETDIFKLSF